ncbi:MAG: hypothetical protein WC637_00115 [Victivallales bacterium]|jgi:hypothetical protein
MKTEKQLDDFIDFMRASMTSYYCKWCKRSLPNERGVFIHDDVFHPEDYAPESGGEHRLQ